MANDYVIAPPYKEFYDIFSTDPSYSDALTLITTPLSGPFNGTVQMSADGTVNYTPKFDFVGSDSIKYKICDSGNLCATAVAFIKVGYPPFKIYEGVSPNGDNLNDYWRIDGIELYPNNLIRVFDRFNNLVFETSSYSNEKNNWQGQANHGLTHGTLPEGTYFYTVNLGNGEHALSGFVELKRY
jgi:gliding motility-associated-like protein